MFWVVYLPVVGFFWILVIAESCKREKLSLTASWTNALLCWFVTGWTPFIIAKFLN